MAIFVGGTQLSGGGGGDMVKIGSYSKDANANTITCTDVFSSSYDSYLIKLQNMSSGVSNGGSPVATFYPWGSAAAAVVYTGIEPPKDAYVWNYTEGSIASYQNAMNAVSNFLIGTNSAGAWPQTDKKLTLNGEIWIDYKNDDSHAMCVRGSVLSGVTAFTERQVKVDFWGYAVTAGASTGPLTNLTFSPGQGTMSSNSKIVAYGLKP